MLIARKVVMPKSAKFTAAATVKAFSKAAHVGENDGAPASFTQEECIEVSSRSTV